MYMRLAFAVAAHLEPEILIVDEVLAVGDAEFQKRCLGKMGEVAMSGRTVLFVSHNMAAVRRLCGQAFFLRGGRVAFAGKVGDVIQAYSNDHATAADLSRPPHPDGRPTIVAASLLSSPVDTEIILFELQIVSGDWGLVSLDVRLNDGTGNPVGFGSVGALATAQRIQVPPGKKNVRIGLSVDHLATGDYIVSFDLSNPGIEFFDRVDDCLRFRVDRRASAGRDRVLPQAWGYGSYEADVTLYPD
jgi:lipopolysaccharide transport system ATP-binding protein